MGHEIRLLVQWVLEFSLVVANLVQRGQKSQKALPPVQRLESVRDWIQQVNETWPLEETPVSLKQERQRQQAWILAQRQTALEMAAHQRETALSLAETQKIWEYWPLRLLPSQLLHPPQTQAYPPLRILLAPPYIANNCPKQVQASLRALERCLAEGLRSFLNEHYATTDPDRPTEFLVGAWLQDRFYSEASIKALFNILQTEPTLILECEFEGEVLNLRMAYWGLGQETYYYKTITRIPYWEILIASAQERARALKLLRSQLHHLGEDPEAINEWIGSTATNLQLLELEERWQQHGVDTQLLQFPYQSSQVEVDELCHFLIQCHCLIAGWVTDLYYLSERDIAPRLPSLLPALTDKQVDVPLIEAIATGYQQVYQALAENRRAWAPELMLDLARSLTCLPDQQWAKTYTDQSLTLWLALRLAEQLSEEDLWKAVKAVILASDRPYFEQLRDCYAALQATAQVDAIQQLLQDLDESLNAPHPTPLLPPATFPLLINTLEILNDKISALAISPDDELLVVGGQNGSLTIWNLLRAQLLKTLPGHSAGISSLAISPDGKLLVSVSLDCSKNNLRVWSLPSGKLINPPLGHKRKANFVFIDLAQRLWLAGGSKIKKWDLTRSQRELTLCNTTSIVAATLSADGQWLATGSGDGKIRLWESLRDQPPRALRGHMAAIRSLAFNPEGSRLASADAKGQINLWAIPSGQLLKSIPADAGSLRAIALTTAPPLLISGSDNGTISIWETREGDLLTSFTAHETGLASLVLTHRHDLLVTGGNDQTVKLWKLPRP